LQEQNKTSEYREIKKAAVFLMENLFFPNVPIRAIGNKFLG